MARYHNPKITTNKNLSLVLDAANSKSYTGVTTSVTTTIYDPNVSLLLNGNGTNGSTTFTDSSSYGHTVTPFGSAQISTTQSKFGGASMAFLGSSSDGATISNNVAFEFGTQDFTIECWAYVTSFGNGFFTLTCKWNGSSSGTRFVIAMGASDIGTDTTNLASINYTVVQSISNALNTWYHIAVVRSGTSLYIFRNGTLYKQATISSSQSLTASGDLIIGNYTDGFTTGSGYIDDLRITKGVARYTSNFTPPTAELSLSTTETQQAPVLTDISLNNNTATLYNGVGYTSSNVGYFTFNGINHYMEIPYDESVNLTDGDFTIDFWMNSFSDQTSDVLVSYGNTSTVGGWAIKTATNKLQYSVGFATHPTVAVGIVTSGLVLHLDAGDTDSYPGSGTTWTDLSGNGNNGTLVNGVGYNSANLGSLSFDGVNDVVNSTTSIIDRADGQEITVSCWIKPSRTSGQYSIFCTNRSDNLAIYNWIFYQHITDGAIAFHGDAQNKSSYVPTTNVWINVTNTVTASGVSTLYVNGVSTYTVTGYTYGNGTPSRLGIGADPGGQEPFQGNIAQVSIYNRALTASEVTQNFDVLKGRYTSPSPLDPLDTFGITENADFSSGITTNTWNHYALVRSGNVYTPYVNAVPGNPSYVYGVDSNMDLYFDNASIILNANGDDGSTNIIDSSKNNHTGIITAYNGAGISTSEYKFGGSSLYFDGTDDYIDCGASDAYTFGTGDYTIEFWIYNVTLGQSSNTIISTFNDGNYGGIMVGISNTKFNLTFAAFQGLGVSASTTTYGPSISTNRWYHVALVRENGYFRFFVDGVKHYNNTTTLIAGNYDHNSLLLGKNGRNAFSYCKELYIDDFRITKGVAKYTSDFTPPNQASYYSNDPNYDNLSILLQGNGQNLSTSIIDSSPYNHTGIITAYNGAGISTSEYKFGGSSLYFDGTDDYIDCGTDSSYAMEDGDFTIEFWMYTDQENFANYVFRIGPLYTNDNTVPDGGLAAYVNTTSGGSGDITFERKRGGSSSGSGAGITGGQWNHIAWTRSGSNFYLFVNGTNIRIKSIDKNPYNESDLTLGAQYYIFSGTRYYYRHFNGYIDDFRITKGVAKYTDDFVPPDRTKIKNNQASLKFGTSGIGNTNPFNGALSNLKIYKDSLTQSEITQNFNAHKSRYGL